MYNKNREKSYEGTEENHMEEFIAEIGSNFGKDNLQNHPKKISRFRELFINIANSEPIIRNIKDCDEEGDICFETLIDSMGLNYNDFLKYKDEISSDFFVNFVGEYLVRENMDKFIKIMENLKEKYYSVVNKYEHRKFGMKVVRNNFIFIFHISLIQRILTEDFKRVK